LIEDSFGWLLYKKGDYAGAIVALNRAIQDMGSGEQGVTAKEYYYHLGAAYRKAGQIDDARRTLDIALQYDPTFRKPKPKKRSCLPKIRPPQRRPPYPRRLPPFPLQTPSSVLRTRPETLTFSLPFIGLPDLLVFKNKKK